MKPIPKTYLCCLGSLIVFLILLWIAFYHPFESTFVTQSSRQSPTTDFIAYPQSVETTLESTALNNDNPIGQPINGILGERLRQAIFDAAMDSDKYDLAKKITPLLASLSPEDFPPLAQLLLQVPDDLQPWLVWQEVMKFWGSYDGVSAFNFALANDAAQSTALIAMQAWVATDEQAPLRWLESIPLQEERAFLSKYYIGVWLKQDYRTAMTVIDYLHDPVIRDTAYTQLARTTNYTRDTERRDSVANWMLQRAHDPALAQGAAILASEWVLSDPAGAIQFTFALPEGPTRQTVFRDLIGQWSGVDPNAAAEFLDQPINSPEWEAGVAAYASLILSEQPEQALQWINTITDPKLKKSAEIQLHRKFSQMTDRKQ